MSMIPGSIISMTNTGAVQSGCISPRPCHIIGADGKWRLIHHFTIDRIICKTVDGKRLTRYAVCVDGVWHSNQRMTLREAREHVEQLRADFLTSNPGIAHMAEVWDKRG